MKMDNFLKSVHASSDYKDDLIKKNITSQLSESIKEIQLCQTEKIRTGVSGDLEDASNKLCSAVEAMFLHGLKDSFVHKARRIMGNDFDQEPEPSFWSPLLIFSHSQIISQISNLSNITTEIGQCRAWIRIALNDSFLASYIIIMIQDNKLLKPFYKSCAYMCDSDLIDVAHKLVESIEICNIFTLPYNSSLLNSWPSPTLLLAGVWSPSLKKSPIATGIDIAQSLDNLPSNTDSNVDLSDLNFPIVSQSSELKKMVALNEDEALKIILSNTSYEYMQRVQVTSSFEDIKNKSSSEEKCQPSKINPTCKEASGLGNALSRKSGWSFDETQNEASHALPVNRNICLESAKSTEHSYHALIESYNVITGSYSKLPDLQTFWQYFSDNNGSCLNSYERNDSSHQGLNDIENQVNFEFMSTLEKKEVNSFLLQIGKVAQEKGLDLQNYECFSCKHPLIIHLNKPRVCAFTGYCYCDNCMSPEVVMIPAKIIHNWDFNRYYVSKKAANFLNDIKKHPILDLKILNPDIYKGVEEMRKIESLRIQLNFLRDYIFTCREPVITQFQHLVWPAEYIYEHIHQYSLSDFFQMPEGTIVQHLLKLVKFGREHVINCWLCSQKGFICEVCNNSKVVYPFDVDSTYRCGVCNAVYHTRCLNESKPCPKCERRQKREDISLLNATLE